MISCVKLERNNQANWNLEVYYLELIYFSLAGQLIASTLTLVMGIAPSGPVVFTR